MFNRIWRLTVAVALMAPAPASAQERANCQPSPTEIMACTIPNWRPLAEPVARYPDILRQDRVGGVVHLRISIDTSGRPLMSTLRIVSSTHDLFSTALKNAAPSWRFVKAVKDNVPVQVVYEASFRFVPIGRPYIIRSEGSPPPETRAPVAVPVVDSTEHQRIAWEVVKLLVSRDSATKGNPTYCTSATTHETIFLGGRWLVPMKLCPRTYMSMFAPVRPEDVAPKGWVDPVAYGVQNIIRYGDLLTMRVGRAHGTGKRQMECTALLVEGVVQDVGCSYGTFTIS